RRQQPEDQDTAQALLTLALATAQELGMPRLEGIITRQQAEGFRRKAVGTASSSPVRLQPPASRLPHSPTPNVLRRDADSLTLVTGGRPCRQKAAKALPYRPALLHAPARESHVLDLPPPPDPPPATTAAEAHLSTARRTLRETDASAQAD